MSADPNYVKAEIVHVCNRFWRSRAMAAFADDALSVDDPLYPALEVELMTR